MLKYNEEKGYVICKDDDYIDYDSVVGIFRLQKELFEKENLIITENPAILPMCCYRQGFSQT